MSKGYFSLVQYCPDVARQESVNVGVVLLCPEQKFIGVKMTPGNHRVRRFFGEEADNYQHLNAMKEALAGRISVEKADLLTPDAFGTFVESRANKVLLTIPKPMRVNDAGADLAALYDELVIEPQKPLSVQAAMPLRKRLNAMLNTEPLKPFLLKRLSIKVPTVGETVQVPYAYQNDRLHLIQPTTFEQQSHARVTTQACRFAVEGRSIFEHMHPEFGAMQLTVVAQFRPDDQESPQRVRDIFNEYKVRLYTPDYLDDLATEIVTHGKPISEE
jgi:hypothetical protein